MTAPPLVALRELTKRFGDGPIVLDRVSLSVQPGEFVTLIGPSGCGKSTVLRLIAGLTVPSDGQVAVTTSPAKVADEELGFVFQEPTLLPWLTTEHNIELPLKLRGVPASERSAVISRVLSLVGLADKARAYPRQLSGGQKMRVSIARALALSPKLLLLDEPFGALDEMTRERLNEELLSIRERQAWTALFVTHSVAEAVFLSSRIIVMAAHPGRIHDDLTIDLPYPRTVETRTSERYHALVLKVSQSLRATQVSPAAA
jgi:NitT/TauT family transport system ATP-binding protein